MATRDIYETGFDEDVQTDISANQCPKCNGHVITTQRKRSARTVVSSSGTKPVHGPEWLAYAEDE